MSISPYTTVFEARAMELIELQQWWVECREAHQWIISNDILGNARYAAQMSIIQIKSAAKHAVINWRM